MRDDLSWAGLSTHLWWVVLIIKLANVGENQSTVGSSIPYAWGPELYASGEMKVSTRM